MGERVATVDGAVLEGLARLMEPQGAFADELRAVGFDVQHPEARYSPAVLLAVLDVGARHRFPERTREEAHREIGQRFVEHFFRTFLGRVSGALLQVLGMKRFLLRLPKVAALTTGGLEVLVEQGGKNELRITFRGPDMSPDFTTGAIEGAAQAGKSDLRAEIVRRGAGEFEVRATVTR